jgi:hypothetical protein
MGTRPSMVDGRVSFLVVETAAASHRGSEPKLCIWLDFGPLISYIA